MALRWGSRLLGTALVISGSSVFLSWRTTVHCEEKQPKKKATKKADLVLRNGHIITMDDDRRIVEAMAIVGSRITWVGSDQDAAELYPKSAQLDLQGKTVIPGFIDSHTHLRALGESFGHLNVRGCKSVEEAATLVRARAETAAPGEWIVGSGWDDRSEEVMMQAARDVLDEAAPQNPVILVGRHSFAAWANSEALRRSDVTAKTSNPPLGKILRDSSGEPTGVFTEQAQYLVNRHVPPVSPEHLREALERAAQETVRYGITSVHEAFVSRESLAALESLVSERRMPVRVYAMLDGSDAGLLSQWLEKGPQLDNINHRLTVRAIKFFVDGSLGSRGAALLSPYADETTVKGRLLVSRRELVVLAKKCVERGFQVATHSVGDAAVRASLDAYMGALGKWGISRNARLRIEHAQVVNEDDVPRFAQMGVLASIQPALCTSDRDWIDARVGPERANSVCAWQTLRRTGVRMPLGSDLPSEAMNPLEGLQAAVTREGWRTEESLSLDEALAGYTREGAWAEFAEDHKGSLARGKLADFVVLSHDPLAVTPDSLRDITVESTWVGGERVYP